MLTLIPLLLWAQAINVQQADQLFNSGHYEEAAAQYRQYLKQLPDDPGLLLRLGFCEYSLEDYPRAEQTFRKVLRARPGLAPAQVGLGMALVDQGRAAEALPLLEEAVRQLPEDRQASRALGQAYMETGDFIKGEQTLRGLVKDDPNDWTSWYYLGVLLVNQNYSQPALDALDKSLKLHPDNPRALIYRAGALSQLGRLKESEAQFRALAANDQVNHSSEYSLGYAQLLFLQGKYKEALGRIEAAVRADPRSAKIRYWKARILFYLGEEDAALEEARLCVKLAPNMPGGRNLLLRLYRRRGMAREAAEQAAWLKKYEHRVAMGKGR